MLNNNINKPMHYTSHPSGIEAIEITQYETFLRGNIIKYILRAPYKGNEVNDLKKAAQYLQWEIERAEREEAEDAEAIKLLDEFIARRHEQAKERPTFNQVFFAGENCDCKVLCEDCDWEIENRERNY